MTENNQVSYREFDDPDIDYEYYDAHDFGDEMKEARERGELYTSVDLGVGFHNVCRKLREIKAAKKTAQSQSADPKPYYPKPVPPEPLWVAEEPANPIILR
jgi:hypothetical protein